MSRVGKRALTIPEKVKVQIKGTEVHVEGPKGKLHKTFSSEMAIAQEGNILKVTRKGDGRQERCLHGMTRAILSNMLKGVSVGFKRSLEINGVGYKAQAKGQGLSLTLGFSHLVDFSLPAGVKAQIENNTVIHLESADKELLGEVASQVRNLRPPEPYQGKGIKYAGETIRRKVGKTAGKT